VWTSEPLRRTGLRAARWMRGAVGRVDYAHIPSENVAPGDTTIYPVQNILQELRVLRNGRRQGSSKNKAVALNKDFEGT